MIKSIAVVILGAAFIVALLCSLVYLSVLFGRSLSTSTVKKAPCCVTCGQGEKGITQMINGQEVCFIFRHCVRLELCPSENLSVWRHRAGELSFWRH